MKTFRLGLILASALLCASTARTQPITISWQPAFKAAVGYLPKITSDGNAQTHADGEAMLIYQTDTGDATFEFEDGSVTGDPNGCCGTLSWDGSNYINSPTQPGDEVGHAPSVAMLDCGDVCSPTAPYFMNLVQVHQGGQDNGSALWYRTAVSGYGATIWSASQLYDHGYNPTVALDQAAGTWTGETGDGALVEVHQAGVNSSELLYHVGNFTLSASDPLVAWGSSHDTGFSGYAPTVSVYGGLVVLVAQGSSGELWYSVGQVNTTNNTITWSPVTHYDNGYNPTVSVSSCDLSYVCDWLVVEEHQATNGTGSLWYRVGTVSLSTGLTTIYFAASTKYSSSGCYPSVTQILGLQGAPNQVVESHSDECAVRANILTSIGILPQP
jgi:hypothetical protein